MKNMLTICYIILLLAGCAAVQQARQDAIDCLSDPVCRTEAVAEAEKAKGIAKDISGISPVPLSSNLVGSVVYGTVFLIALIRGGRKKEEGLING